MEITTIIRAEAGLAAVNLSNPQSLNRYAYVYNDPLNWVDPDGLQVAAPEGTRNSRVPHP
jgi:hypothetical protein